MGHSGQKWTNSRNLTQTTDAAMENICVFCGSGTGYHPAYEAAARDLGQRILEEEMRLVYGGGDIGLMGILANTVLEGGGEVIGVIPRFLYDKEVGHDGLTRLFIVDSMHERKQKMAELSQGFAALPGGIGTMEELFEIFTWTQLSLIKRPVALLNVHGYFDPLLAFLEKMVHEGFLRPETHDSLIRSDNSLELIARMKGYTFTEREKWIGRT
jgi:uncharacterized protein (TIGR00730 family)